jgi:hypothetical protein
MLHEEGWTFYLEGLRAAARGDDAAMPASPADQR